MKGAKFKNRMGVMSGLTKRFSISEKKGLKDPHVIFLDGERVSKSVQTWIQEFPTVVYSEVYSKHNIELASDSMKLFKTTLQIHHPDLLQKIEERKQVHRVKKQ